MKILLNDNEYNSKDIQLIDGNKILSVMFVGICDLHWVIHKKDYIKQDEHAYDLFVVTKENYQVYYLFEKLINDIKNINIYNRDEYYFSTYIETEEEKREYLEELEFDKERYRKFNMYHYNDLFD